MIVIKLVILIEKNQDTLKSSSNGTAPSSTSTSSKKSKYNRIIQIQLDYGFDNNYSLLIDSEYSMKDTSGDLGIPSMICKSENEGYLITRQRGFLGVEARTNVEISDIGNQGLNIVVNKKEF